MRHLRLHLSATLVVLATAALQAQAGFVSVQSPAGSVQVPYPQIAAVDGPGYRAMADLGSGTFQAESSANNGNSLAYSGFSVLQLRYVGTTPVTLPAHWLTAAVSGSFSVPEPPQSTGNQALSQVNLSVVSGADSSSAAYVHQISRLANGPININSGDASQGGANTVVSANSASSLVVELRLAPVTLVPNQVIRLSGLLTTNVLSNGGTVFADFYDSYQLSMRLPPGFEPFINTATGMPFTPAWITVVPEPATRASLLLGLVLLALGGWRRRRAPCPDGLSD